MTVRVRVEGVSKTFHPSKRRPLRSRPAAAGRSTLALEDVSLVLRAGQSLALLGANGAGKTTLLRLIAGVGRPDRGTVAVTGRVGALLELGAGNHPDLTGRENAVLSMVVSGLTHREAVRRLDVVVAFAELEDVLDRPLRTYSSGMKARLSFSVAVHVDTDLLLCDELLAVGDLAFQQRCRERVADLQLAGVSLLLVSHDPAVAAALCERAILLSRGRVLLAGPVGTVAAAYEAEVAGAVAAATPTGRPRVRTASGTTLVAGDNRWGTQDAELTGVRLSDAKGRPTSIIAPGDALQVTMNLCAPSQAHRLQVSVAILREEDGAVCVDLSRRVAVAAPRTALRLSLDRLDLAPGRYAVAVGVYDEQWQQTFDYHDAAYPFTVSGERLGKGLLRPPARWHDGDSRAEGQA